MLTLHGVSAVQMELPRTTGHLLCCLQRPVRCCRITGGRFCPAGGVGRFQAWRGSRAGVVCSQLGCVSHPAIRGAFLAGHFPPLLLSAHLCRTCATPWRNWVTFAMQHAAVTVWMAALQELHGYMLLQDTELQWRRGDVTLKQVVPKGEWRSIPRPEIKVQQGSMHFASSCLLGA